MLTYNQIRNHIIDDFGFKTIEDYRAFLSGDKVLTHLSDPEIRGLLSPDKVNCVDFWKVCEDLFGNDPICNTSVAHDKVSFNKNFDIVQSNRKNLMIAKLLGMLNFVDEFAGASDLSVLEIGTGLGCFQNYIATNSKWNYIGFDVVPRTPGVYSLNRDGVFPDTISDLYRTQYMVYSSNVFQHLSDRQRTHYLEQAFKLLRPGGLFLFNAVFDNGMASKYRFDGRFWTGHYGQYTPCMVLSAAKKQLEDIGFTVGYVNMRHDHVGSVVAVKPS